MRKKRKITVRKAGGGFESLNERKFRSSLIRSGASPEMVDVVMEAIIDQVGPETTTREIYRLAHGLLKKKDSLCEMRYSLKRALFRLGPTGYPFERYIADILEEYGFRTRVGVTLEGKCISHEVDVLAVSDKEVRAMECKYHNSKGTTTDVKVALYVRSRVLDLEPALSRRHREKKFSGWLVTNTRCTTDAIEYARCAGLEILSWKYPAGGGLEEMIEKKKLYPVTILYGLQAGLVNKLIQQNILLLRDVLSFDDRTLQRRLDVPPQKVRSLKKRAGILCG